MERMSARKINRMEFISWLAVGVILVTASMVLGLLIPEFEKWAHALWIAGAAALVVSLVNYIRYIRRPDVPREDERTRKIRGTDMTLAWFFSWLFVSLIWILNSSGVVNMSANDVLGAVSVFMVISGTGLYFLLRLKGDVG